MINPYGKISPKSDLKKIVLAGRLAFDLRNPQTAPSVVFDTASNSDTEPDFIRQIPPCTL